MNFGDKKINISLDKNNSENKRKGLLITGVKGKTTFIERLKDVSKKDLAWLLLGVIILILAPVSQYFLTKPKTDTTLKSGFGERRSDVSGLYEPGINALSAGSPDGMGDIIAPLAARDPASLILGSKKETPPPPPPSIPPTTRDSIADIAKKTFPEATKAAAGPFIPPSKLQTALRGAGSFFGGGGTVVLGSRGAGIISEAKKASSKTQQKNIIGAQAIPGYKGVARSDYVNKGAYEKLRTKADSAGDYFSKAGAKEALEGAAAQLKGIGDAGGGLLDGAGMLSSSGRPGDFSNNTIPNRWQYNPGDPCSGSIQKMLECERAKKKLEFEMWLKYGLPKDLIKLAADNIIGNGLMKPIGDSIASRVSGFLNPAPPRTKTYCWIMGPNGPIATQELKVGYDKDGKPYVSPPGYTPSDCPCGYATDAPYPSCKSTGTITGSGPTNQQGDPNHQLSEYERFDTALKTAVEAAKLGKEANSVKILKEQTIKAAKNIEDAISAVQNITQINNAIIDKNIVANSLPAYQVVLDSAQVQVDDLKKQYDVVYKKIAAFDEKLKKAKELYSQGKIKPIFSKNDNITAVGETLGGEDVIKTLDDAIKSTEENIDKLKKEDLKEIERLDNGLKAHRKALMWYSEQINIVRAINSRIYANTGGHAKEIENILSQVQVIPDNTANSQDIKNLKAQFSYLTGKEAINVIESPQTPTNVSGNATSKIDSNYFRAAVKDEDKIKVLINWRACDEKQLWDSGKIDDSVSKKVEKDEFDRVKPSEKLKQLDYSQYFDKLNDRIESFIISKFRMENISQDIEEAKNVAIGNIINRISGIYLSIFSKERFIVSLMNDKNLKYILEQVDNANNSPSQNTSPSNQQPQNNPAPSNQPSQPIQTPIGPVSSSICDKGDDAIKAWTQNSCSSQYTRFYPPYYEVDIVGYRKCLSKYSDNPKKEKICGNLCAKTHSALCVKHAKNACNNVVYKSVIDACKSKVKGR